jgi:hypothetical protein
VETENNGHIREVYGCPQRIRTQNCNLELSHAHIRDEESCDSPGGQFPARRSKFLAVLDPVQPPQSHLRQRVHMRNQPPASAAENPVGQVSGLRGSLTRRIKLMSKLLGELMGWRGSARRVTAMDLNRAANIFMN